MPNLQVIMGRGLATIRRRSMLLRHRFTTCVVLLLALWATAKRGQVALAVEHDAALRAALASITVPELRHHAGLLADDSFEGRAAGSRGGRAAARYIEDALRAAQLVPAGSAGSYTQRFRGDCQNLLATLPGSDPDSALRDEWILVGAHYDHVGYGDKRTSNGPWGYVHNGADDNASGVAALLEAIDALRRVGLQPRRSVLFAFWDAEEQGLLGSRHWVAEPTIPIERLKLAINIDMIGRMVDHRLEIVGTRTGTSMRKLLCSRDLPESLRLDFNWELKDNSDHWPLFEAGVPSICLHTGLHADYHRPSDDVEKLNLQGMHSATTYLAQILVRLADAPALPTYRAAARGETPHLQRQREQPLPPLAPRLGVAWRKSNDDPQSPLMATRVEPGSPASQAGLSVGDRLAKCNGKTVDDPDALAALILQAPSPIELTIQRNERERVFRVELHGPPVQLGLAWRADPAEPGVVFLTRVVPSSPAWRAGLKPMDRVIAVGGEPIADPDHLYECIQKELAKGSAELIFETERDGRIGDVRLVIDPYPVGTGDFSL